MIELTEQQYKICKILVETGDSPAVLAGKVGVRTATVRMHLDHARIKVSKQLDKPIDNVLQLVLALQREGFTNAKKEDTGEEQ